jgi:putative membrane protein
MLWIQGFHVIFVVCWFAGIFYLPRILVYYAQSPAPETKAVLAVMARKLYRFVTPLCSSPSRWACGASLSNGSIT